jgi:hypothetical protein
MRVDQEDTNAFNTLFKSVRFSYSTKTIIGDAFITVKGQVVNAYDPAGGDCNVYLPPYDQGRFISVANIGTTFNLLVRTSGGTLVATVRPSQTVLLFSGDNEWHAIRGGGTGGGYDVFTNTVDGLVPAPHSAVPGSLFLRDDGQWGQVQVTGIVDSFKYITDGVNTAIGSGPDTFWLRSSTSKVGITVTNNQLTYGDNANFTVNEAFVDHNLLLNYSADRHVAHTGVVLTAGLGISGGGDISASRTFDFAPSELTIAAPVATDYVVFDLAAGGPRRGLISVLSTVLDHNTLVNYDPNRHFDHTTISMVASTGLTGGGTIAASRSFALDFNSLVVDTIATGDWLPFYDISGSDHNKITFANFNASLDITALNGYSANKFIDHTTVSINTTEGIQGGGTIAATRTLKLDISGLTQDTSPDLVNDFMATFDASAGLHKKVLLGAVGAAPATAIPLVNAVTGVVGASIKYAREDHVHPITAGSSTVTISDTPPGAPVREICGGRVIPGISTSIIMMGRRRNGC